jgi:thioredoxin-like negative regulator of GroEL
VLRDGTIGCEETLGRPQRLGSLPERYGVGTLPVVLFFQDGRVVDQLSGVVDRADMAAKLHILTRNSHA